MSDIPHPEEIAAGAVAPEAPAVGAPEGTPQHTSLTGRRRQAALGFIFAAALMDILALSIMIPVLPNLIKQLAGGGTAQAAHAAMIFGVTWGLMQFFCAPVIGMLSDRFGRRPVLLISIFGLGIDYLFMALAPTLGWLFVGRVINGATAASFSTANAYIADVTPPEGRAKAFSLMGAAFGIGFVIGPGIGGWLGTIDLRLPFFVSASLALINWLYGFFVLPESLPKERRAGALNWAKANPVGALDIFRTRPTLIPLSAVQFLFQLAHSVFPSIFVLYVGWRFGWGVGPASYMLMATGLLSILMQSFVTGRAVTWLKERGALMVGLASAAAAFFAYGLAPSGPWFYAAVPVGALSAFSGPSLMSLMSRRVSPSEQGRLQGANSAIMGVTSILGPALYPSLLSFTVRRADPATLAAGAPIMTAGVIVVVALVLAFFWARPVADVTA